MEPRALQFIADASGGRLVRGLPGDVVKGICTDSRKAGPGDLFIAIPGERFDGHQFVGSVASAGVAAVLVLSGRLDAVPGDCGIIEVQDIRQALGRLAGAYRRQFQIPCIAVAGSNGKTTTKELVAAVLRQSLETLWSEASFNNDIGVPLTLLRLDSRHRAAVLELGTNHPGELAPLVDMACPRIGVITSIGREHLEFFKDLNGVVEEEGALAEGLPGDGVLILPGDSEWAGTLAARARCRIVRVGLGEGNDWRAADISLDTQGTRFRVTHAPAGFEGPVQVPLLGRHQVTNAMFAMAVGAELGLDPATVRRGLGQCRPAKSRMVLTGQDGYFLLDDSYNANADSMRAALAALSELPCGGRRIAVLGDMAELGDHTRGAHEEIGHAAARSGIDLLVTTGTHSSVTLAAAVESGVRRAVTAASVEEVVSLLRGEVRAGDIVLVKASRSAGLDRIGESLRRSSHPPAGGGPAS